jgi:hypothetical protein
MRHRLQEVETVRTYGHDASARYAREEEEYTDREREYSSEERAETSGVFRDLS